MLVSENFLYHLEQRLAFSSKWLSCDISNTLLMLMFRDQWAGDFA
jgi:hypothetical protein